MSTQAILSLYRDTLSHANLAQSSVPHQLPLSEPLVNSHPATAVLTPSENYPGVHSRPSVIKNTLS